ncbi:MAG: DUF5069 domain-containing protein [Verrucomicrobiaceae bacterium]|nr:MAG: DUF5069 domain-containing protein [Verrucomicrobiaceae bacterium]
MEKLVPLISSGTAGPLGILHLPRLWSKALLGASGKLADGYKDIGPGYDHMVLQGLGIDPEQARSFVREQKPSYPQFEAWVKSYPGVKLDRDTISQINAAVAGYIHTDEVRKEILASCHLPDDGSVNPGAIDLNNLDDWQAFHATVTNG